MLKKKERTFELLSHELRNKDTISDSFSICQGREGFVWIYASAKEKVGIFY